jgi:hypothetical protein
MARQTKVELVDDISGGTASETVTFGLDGTTYGIELNDKNAKKLRDALGPYIEHGRRVSRARSNGRARRGGQGWE